MRNLALLLVAFPAMAAPLAGQEVPDSVRAAFDFDSDRFELFAECAPVFLIEYVQGGQAEEIGLTEERVRTMAESRLRAARLYGRGPPVLEVTIMTLDDGPAFVRWIELSKRLRDDDMTGLSRSAVTWTSLSIGTHGGDAGFVMQGLSEQLDAFIGEYLRVNESYC